MTLRGYPLALIGYAIFLLLLLVRLPYDASVFLLTFTTVIGLLYLDYRDMRDGCLQHAAIAVFVGIGLLCAYYSKSPYRSYVMLAPLVPAIMGYVSLAGFAKSARNRQLILWALLLLGLSAASLIIWQRFSLVSTNAMAYMRQANSPLLLVPNDSIILSMIAVLSLSMWSKGGWMTRACIAVFILASLTATIILGSRQGTGLLLGGIGLWALLCSPRKLLPLVIAIGVFALAVDAFLGWPLLGRFTQFSRGYVWYSGWLMFLDHPILGVGPGGFKELYFTYLNRAGYDVLSLPDHRRMPWVHNLYLEQLAERGVVGLFGLFTLYTALVAGLIRLWRSPALTREREYVVALVSVSVVFAIAAINELTFQRLWVVIFLFLIAGLIVAAKDSQSDLQQQ